MGGYASKRLIGRVTSFVAAYALVLQIVLASFVLATMSAGPAMAMEICSPSMLYGVATGDADKSPSGPASHCPVCVVAHSPAVPAPDALTCLTRDSFRFTYRSVPVQRVDLARAETPHQPRAPPQIG